MHPFSIAPSKQRGVKMIRYIFASRPYMIECQAVITILHKQKREVAASRCCMWFVSASMGIQCWSLRYYDILLLPYFIWSNWHVLIMCRLQYMDSFFYTDGNAWNEGSALAEWSFTPAAGVSLETCHAVADETPEHWQLRICPCLGRSRSSATEGPSGKESKETVLYF